MSKTKKANGFLHFMLEYRRDQAAKGNTMDMIESQNKAGPLWEKMDSHERSKYTGMSSTISAPTKFTSFGVSFNEMDKGKQELKRKQMQMESKIDEMVTLAAEENNLKSLTFYFFSTSYFAQTLSGDIFPAEIAMAKFSLSKGVFDSFCMKVNPGNLPLGAAADAKQHSEKTHKIVLPPDCDGETSYATILRKILNFVGADTSDPFPPIFVTPDLYNDNFKAANFTLDKILSENKLDNFQILVYPTEYLLLKLQKKYLESIESPLKPFTSILTARDALHREKFMYTDIGCKYHRVLDANEHCSLSKVKRWGYAIATSCLSPSKDELIPGRHIPPNSKTFESDDEDFQDDAFDDVSDSFMSLRLGTLTTTSKHSGSTISTFANKSTKPSEVSSYVPTNFDSTSSQFEIESVSSTSFLGGRGRGRGRINMRALKRI